jgi:DNA polymerase-1
VEELFESKGVRPDQVVDMLALMGDPTDNVPGVKGVGIKTAAKLITEYGSLDALLSNLDKVKGKTGEAIAAQQGILPLSRRLVALKEDVDVRFALDDAKVDPKRADAAVLDEEMHRLGFNRHAQDLRSWLGVSGKSAGSAGGAAAAGAASVAAPAARAKLWPIYAFNLEVARAPWVSTQPLIATQPSSGGGTSRSRVRSRRASSTADASTSTSAKTARCSM